MLLYLDTSAFVPLIIDERSSDLCRLLWADAESIASSVLLDVETMAALGMAHRTGRISSRALRSSVSRAEDLLEQVALISLDAESSRRAGQLAVDLGLRGYDAAHVATAHYLSRGAGQTPSSPDVLVASGDRQLLKGCASLGLTTVDTA